VFRVLARHSYACNRHHYWIGPPDITSHPLPALDGLPEVITAQRRHHHLTRQHSWAAAYDAILTGFLICASIWNQSPQGEFPAVRARWDQRPDQPARPRTGCLQHLPAVRRHMMHRLTRHQPATDNKSPRSLSISPRSTAGWFRAQLAWRRSQGAADGALYFTHRAAHRGIAM
jgi:hypothetical protein